MSEGGGAPPARFRDWRVVRQLGGGGFGRVWEVRWDSEFFEPPRGAPRRAAAKVALALPGRSDALLQEAKGLISLDHPGVVQVYDAFRDDAGSTVLVMELASGHLGEQMPIPARAMWEAVEDVADGLAYLHTVGRVHHDIKADNVLRCDGRWKLSDLGITVDLGSATHGYADIHNVWLRPPESVRDFNSDGTPRVRPTWDIWAVGLMAHRMLTGRDPRPGLSPEACFVSSVQGLTRVDPAIEPGLRSVIEACLELDPTARIADGAALVAALRQMRRRNPIPRPSEREPASPPVAAPDRVPKPTRNLPQPGPTVPSPVAPTRPLVVRVGPARGSTRVDLAASVVEHWNACAQVLSAREGAQNVITRISRRWGRDLARSVADTWDIEVPVRGHRRAAQLVVALDPQRPPQIGPESIGPFIEGKVLGEYAFQRRDFEVLDLLLSDGLLPVFAGHVGFSHLARLGQTWAESHEAYVRWAEVAGTARPTAGLELLVAVCSPEDEARLKRYVLRDLDGAHAPSWAAEAWRAASRPGEQIGVALAITSVRRAAPPRPDPVSKPPPPPPTPPRAKRRRRRSWPLAAAVSLILALAAVTYAYSEADRRTSALRDSYQVAVSEVGEVGGPSGDDVAAVSPWARSVDGCVFHTIEWRTWDQTRWVDGPRETQVRACEPGDIGATVDLAPALVVDGLRPEGPLVDSRNGLTRAFNGRSVNRAEINLLPVVVGSSAVFALSLLLGRRRRS